MIHDSDIQLILTMVQPEMYAKATNCLHALQQRIVAEVEKRAARKCRDRDKGTRADLYRQSGRPQR